MFAPSDETFMVNIYLMCKLEWRTDHSHMNGILYSGLKVLCGIEKWMVTVFSAISSEMVWIAIMEIE